MKKTRIIKGIIAIATIIVSFVSLGLFGYSLHLYNGIETFYRIYGVIILLYISIVLSYSILKTTTKKKIKGFIIAVVISLIFSFAECALYYYLTKVYQAIDAYSTTENTYSSSLITYNSKLKTFKDLKDMKIGIINDKEDIEGYVLPNDIINELKLSDTNEIKKYNSSIELLVALKNKDIDAAFFSSNYVDMFYTVEGYEDIENETVVLYKESKKYNVEEDTYNTSESSFTKPFTILFIGVDSSNDGVTSGYNADVLILVTFNPKTLQATMTSIPRDMYMKTACSGSAYKRINTTTWGSSSSCAVKTVENLFGVSIDYYAKINFKGVVQLVDSVGGIDIDVDYALCDQNSSRSWGNNTVFVDAGLQHLNGEQALAVARNRHVAGDGFSPGKQMSIYCPDRTDGIRNDYTRGKNQLKVIMGVVKAATKLKDANQALKILEDISKNFQTNIKSKDVMELYGLGKTLLLSESGTNLINVQRMQLKGYNSKIWDVSSKSYPSVTIPYTGSINDIKKEININLGNKSATMIKQTSFSINNLYKDEVLGQGSYSQAKINTLKDVSSYSVDQIKSYASSNSLSLKFIDVDNSTNVTLTSWGEYKFYSQGEHVDTIVDQLSTLTIYVKKSKTTTTPTPETSTIKETSSSSEKPEETTSTEE